MINQVAYVRADVFTCTYVPAHFRAASEEKMPARSPRRGVQLYSEVFMHVRTIAHGRRSITRTYRFTYVRTYFHVRVRTSTYVRTVSPTYVRTYVRTYVHIYVPYVRTVSHTYCTYRTVRALATYRLTHVRTYLREYARHVRTYVQLSRTVPLCPSQVDVRSQWL